MNPVVLALAAVGAFTVLAVTLTAAIAFALSRLDDQTDHHVEPVEAGRCAAFGCPATPTLVVDVGADFPWHVCAEHARLLASVDRKAA